MTTAVSRSLATRVIHLLLLLSVLCQLGTSQFMRRPFPGDAPSTTFSLHEYVGLGSLAIVGAFWVWALLRHGETRLGRLLPWFSAKARSAVFGDAMAQLRLLVRLHAPTDDDGALASAVHGLGLLAVSFMALSGTVYYVVPHLGIGREALTLHKVFANLIWAYLIAHAGTAVLHHVMGSDIFSRMFWPRRGGHGRYDPAARV